MPHSHQKTAKAALMSRIGLREATRTSVRERQTKAKPAVRAACSVKNSAAR